MMRVITALVTDVQPVRATRSGNTVKRVTLSVATAGWPGIVTLDTYPDSSIALEIENSEYREQPHDFAISTNGRIIYATASHLQS